MVTSWSNGRPNRRYLGVSVAAGVLVAMSTSPWTCTPPPMRIDAVAQVHALARAMYPSLVGQNLRARVVSDLYFDAEPLPLTSFLYSIEPGSGAKSPALLTADVFRVADNGMIETCFVTGEFVNTTRHMALQASLSEHPDWSEAQDIQALREGGAEFGPWNREAFLAQTLPRLRALGPEWGRLTSWTAEFEGRQMDAAHETPLEFWRMVVTLRPAARYASAIVSPSSRLKES